ncbi:MAG: acyl carrier protein [Chromatiales bacterium]|nr:MAG: acyl carrier protein [Chromatiales bacterium]
MEQAEIEKQLIELIVPLLDEPAPIAPDTDLVQEVGLPSLKVMELIVQVEDTYDISYPLNQLQDVRTVKDLASSVQQLMP